MHNSLLWSFNVPPLRKREEKEKGGGGGCKDEVLHESVPGPQPTLWRHGDEDLVLPSTVFSFPSLFYGWWRTSSYTQSWMGKHEISSNVLQLNTVKKKKEKKERKKERKEETTQVHEPFVESGSEQKGEEELWDAVTVQSKVFRVWTLTFVGSHGTTTMSTPLSCLEEEAHYSLST